MVSPSREVSIWIQDLRLQRVEKVEEYGVKTLPAFVVDGRLVSCCENGGSRREDVEVAGIGWRLT